MKTFQNLVPILAFLCCFYPSSGQEVKAEKFENVEFFSVTLFKWEDGKRDDAMKMINEYFKPSAQDAGQRLPVMELDLLYSDFDHMVIFPMEEGLEVFEWKTSPADAKWMNALQKRVGSEEKVQEMWVEFGTYVDHSRSMLARKTN